MNQNGRLPEIDCLRGIAALSVVVFHFTMMQPSLHCIFKFGCMGVDLFFMISGFVIFLTIEKTISYQYFLISRLAKLYPAYWVCVTLTTSLIVFWSLLVNTPINFLRFSDYLINLTMFQHYFNVKNIDGPYWTLLFELLFYAFILIVYLLRRINRIEIISFGFLLSSLFYGTILKVFFKDIHDYIKIFFPLITFSPLFLSGILFYKIKFSGVNSFRVFLIVLCFSTQIILFAEVVGTDITQFEYAIMLFFFFTIFTLYCFDLLTFVVNKPILFFGRISYSLYLSHQYISVNLLIPLLTLSKHFHFYFWVADFIITLPLVIILAYFINNFIETPAMNYIKKHLKVI